MSLLDRTMKDALICNYLLLPTEPELRAIPSALQTGLMQLYFGKRSIPNKIDERQEDLAWDSL